MQEQAVTETEEVSEAGEADATDAAGKTAKRERTNGERAQGNLKAAKRHLREVTDPQVKAQFMLAEANVLALLALAESFNGKSAEEG